MGYVKTVWTNGEAPAISADNLNKLESQYDEAKSDIDDVAADLTTHETDTEAHGRTGGILPLTQLPALPENYVWRGNSSNRPEAVSFDTSSAIPTGVICMWSGTLASIPSGWALCDGNNGTPNLLDRFVVGVPTNGTNPGATGGSTSKTTTGHNHAGSSGSAGSHGHSGSTSTSGSHGHSPSGHQIREGETTGSRLAIYSLSADGSHDHSVSISASGSHNHSVSIGTNTDTIADIRPKYYALAFIMKL
jgi:hypothetical protein